MFWKWLAMLALLMPVYAQAQASAADVVRQTTNQLFEAIEQQRIEYKQNPEELEDVVRRILLPRLDTDYTGRLVLGRHARGLTQEQINAFTDALGNMLIERYARQLIEFKSRDQVKVLPVSDVGSKARTRVQTRVKLVTGQTVPVDYIMHYTDQGWQVFDVVVEGISYVVTFRGQFDSEFTQHSFQEVLNRIRRGNVEVATDESDS